jgi:hypothetical protein
LWSINGIIISGICSRYLEFCRSSFLLNVMCGIYFAPPDAYRLPHDIVRKFAAAAYACFLLAFLVGLVALSIGLLRLGFIDSILSRPLLRGRPPAWEAAFRFSPYMPWLFFGHIACGAVHLDVIHIYPFQS